MAYRVRIGGLMGAPISFLQRYNPEQFEIVAMMSGAKGGECDNLIMGNDNRKFAIDGVEKYSRVLIRRK